MEVRNIFVSYEQEEDYVLQ